MLVEKRLKNFRLIAAAALADGELHEEEQKVLLDVARDLGLGRELAAAAVEELVAAGPGAADLAGGISVTEKDRAYLFAMLVRVIAADGKLHEKERELLRRIGPSFGYTAEQVEKVAAAAAADAAARLAPRPPAG